MSDVISNEIDQHLAQEERHEDYEGLLADCSQLLTEGDVITCNGIDYSYQTDVLDRLAVDDEFCEALALIHSDKEAAMALIEKIASEYLERASRDLADGIIESRSVDTAEEQAYTDSCNWMG